MRIGFFLSNSGSGGAYNQTIGFLNQLKKINIKKNEICIISDNKNVESICKDLNFKIFIFKKNLFHKILFFIKGMVLLNKFFNLESIINPFQNFLKKNNFDLVIFSNPSYYSLYCENQPFVINIWNTEIKKYNNFDEFISGGYSYQKKIIDHAVDKSFKIFVFTEKNKQDLIKYFNCHDIKVSTQNLTPSITNFYEAHRDYNYKKDFERYQLEKNKKWFFYPAQFWPHKNHIYLLEVIKFLKEKNYDRIGFVFCGPDKGNLAHIKKKIQEYKIQDSVRILGFISNTELISLYKYSEGIVIPTYLGRSSLPLLEGLYFQKKIFYSKNVLDKTLSQYVDEFDLENFKDLANKLLSFMDKKEKKDLSKVYDSLDLESSFVKSYESVIEEFSILQKKWKSI